MSLIVAASGTRYGGDSVWTDGSFNVTIAADFTDGSSGVFKYSFVPEPATAEWVIAGLALLRRRRR